MLTEEVIYGAPEEFDGQSNLSRAAGFSLLTHAIIIALFLFKASIEDSHRIPIVPSLRVDLVGLPDLTKEEMKAITKVPEKTSETKVAPEKEKTTDEMVVDSGKKKSDVKARKEKMSSALKKIQALSRVENDPALVIKGNKVSEGTSLSGEATENVATKYLSTVLERLQSNWSLPVWLSRQNFQAQVIIFINSYGNVQGLRWVKASGNAQFDEAVKQCISSSQPFQIPPTGIRGNLLSDGVLLGFPL